MQQELATSLTKLPRPVLKLFQALFADTGTDVGQTGTEILHANGPDILRRHMQQLLTEGAQRAHGGIFGEGGDVRAGETCKMSN